MAEVLGKLDPSANADMLTDYDALTDLEQSEVTLALSGQADRIIAEAEASEKGMTIGKFIVGLPDGRVTTASYTVSIFKEQEK